LTLFFILIERNMSNISRFSPN